MTIFSEPHSKGVSSTIHGPSVDDPQAQDKRREEVDLKAIGWTHPVRSLHVECSADSVETPTQLALRFIFDKVMLTALLVTLGVVAALVAVVVFVIRTVTKRLSTAKANVADSPP